MLHIKEFNDMNYESPGCREGQIWSWEDRK